MSFILVWFLATNMVTMDYTYSSKTACLADAKRMILAEEVMNPTMMMCQPKETRVFSHVDSFKLATTMPL